MNNFNLITKTKSWNSKQKFLFPSYTCQKSKIGFTLIEIAIVLVVIGLVTGGVLVGRDLIKSAELRSQIKQIEQFAIATQTFKNKYNALPGDILPSQARQLGFFTFTGTYAGKFYAFPSFAPFGSYIFAFGNNDGTVNFHEQLAYWQHLTQARMIPGNYGTFDNPSEFPFTEYLDDNTDNGVTTLTYGTGWPFTFIFPFWGMEYFMPSSKLTGILYDFIQPLIVIEPNNLIYGSRHYPVVSSNNFYAFGANSREAFTIDSKVDDGKPNGGKIRNRCSSNLSDDPAPSGFCGINRPNCMNGTSAYKLTAPANSIDDNRCVIDWLW